MKIHGHFHMKMAQKCSKNGFLQIFLSKMIGEITFFFISEPIGGITWLLHTSPLVVPVPFLSFRIKYIGIFFRSFLSRENLNSNFKWIFQDINYVDYRGWKRVDFAQIHDIRCKVISLKSIRPTKHKLALVKNCLSIQPNTEPIWALHCENLP